MKAMQIRKIYKNVNPGLLYEDVKDFATKQGLNVDEEKQETFSIPTNSTASIFRGTLIFRGKVKTGDKAEYLHVHIEGSDTSEIKMILDINTDLFPQDRVTAFQNDLDFLFSSYEI
jgi:hypothetical protein